MTTTFSGLVHDRGFNADNVIAVTASLTLDPAVHAGRLMKFAVAGGCTVTLPAATGSGQVYKFLVTVAFTTAGIIRVANSSDTMIGHSSSGTFAGTAPFVEGVGGTDDTITLGGSTTGGLIGSYIELTDYATNLWFVTARIVGSGTMATSFSATI